MTVFERLQQKIKNQHGIDTYDFKRLRPGNWMRLDGAFVWEAKTTKAWTIGSTWTATELLKSPNTIIVENPFGELEVFPDD